MNPIIFIGDSLTFGFGLHSSEGFVYKISKQLPSEVILNKGINGDTTTGILSRYHRDVLSKKPKAVSILCGTNDLLSGRSVQSIVENIELMIKDLLEINASIIVCTPPLILKGLAEELFSYSSYYDHAVKSLPILKGKLLDFKKIYPIETLDLYTLTKDNVSNGIFLDGIHLNSLGNELILNHLLPLIKGF